MAVTIDDVWNFRRFEVSVEQPPEAAEKVREALSGLAVLDTPQQARVQADALRRRIGLSDDERWSRGFAAMIDVARLHGWIRDAPLAILAHVVWSRQGQMVDVASSDRRG